MFRTMVRTALTISLVGLLTSCASPYHLEKPAKDQSLSELWAATTDTDRNMVEKGFFSAEILRLDREIAQLIPDGEAIMAAHDSARAREWSKQYNAAMAQRESLVRQGNARAKEWLSRQPDYNVDRCIDPANGENHCRPRKPSPPVVNRWCDNGGGVLVPCG